MVFAQSGTLNLSDPGFDQPAQRAWLRLYCVFERATYALEEIVAARKINKFNGLSQKTQLYNKLYNGFYWVNQHF